jgi:hypothetical protein
MKLSKSLLDQAESEAAIIANVSFKFEEVGIEVPVLTAYETKQTKISTGILGSRKMVVNNHVSYLIFVKLITNYSSSPALWPKRH